MKNLKKRLLAKSGYYIVTGCLPKMKDIKFQELWHSSGIRLRHLAWPISCWTTRT